MRFSTFHSFIYSRDGRFYWLIDKVEAPCCAGRFFMLCKLGQGYLGGFLDKYIDLSTNYDIARGTNTPHHLNRKGAFIYKEGDWK